MRRPLHTLENLLNLKTFYFNNLLAYSPQKFSFQGYIHFYIMTLQCMNFS